MTPETTLNQLTDNELCQESDQASMEQMRYNTRLKEIQAEQRKREKAQEARRSRFLPTYHPKDSLALGHCVSCGELLRVWEVDEGYHSYDRPSRGKLKQTLHPCEVVLGGLRCHECRDILLEKILNMLEKEHVTLQECPDTDL